MRTSLEMQSCLYSLLKSCVHDFLRREVKSRLEKEIDGFKLEVIDASDTFYAELKDVTEPEKKRKGMGRKSLGKKIGRLACESDYEQ